MKTYTITINKSDGSKTVVVGTADEVLAELRKNEEEK